MVDPDGIVVGEGTHLGPGERHAEVVALEAAGPGARGGTLFVSLEPCSHHGRTPPCVDAVVAAGVARVVVGAIDPDPRVSGRGVSALGEVGIEVVVAEDAAPAEAVDPGYFKQRRTGLPRVTLKWAMTLDGAVAAADGSSQWVTSEEAREDAHRLRATMDAVVVGAGTLIADDPYLDARIDSVQVQPVPVIVAGGRPLPADRRIWEREPLIVSGTGIELVSGELIVVDTGADGLPEPEATARALADRGLYDLLLEGGPALAGSWWRSGLIQRGIVYLAGRVGGGGGMSPLGGVFETMAQSRETVIRETTMVGPDLRIEFE